ncbi:DoxX family protein [Cesiribacter andamanensis]|uniref:DoxX n=1 Tax=Cesiribacter andamanensis AMV16 TaxID=1279009 RepID=M7N9W2_9BACT|nr:DoxX family protein [Cesiribacter andamanensis]EMR03996.1 DoxX [Cesiribacter andamanensis AMV16]
MKQLFSTSYNRSLADAWLLILRLGVAAAMMTHGYPKLMKLVEGGELKFSDPLGIGVAASLALAVFAEFFCSILLGLGLATRFAALALSITMGVAAFIQHGADPFARKEMALLYLMIFLTLLVFGPGRYALDSRLGGKPAGKGAKKKARA